MADDDADETERGFPEPFMLKDRKEAGALIAKKLKALGLKNPLALAIPRGGVTLGCEIAKALGCELDIVTPRKLHAPKNSELAIGAIMHDGSVVLNEEVIRGMVVSDRYVESEKETQKAESLRRLTAYRGERPYPNLKGRDVIIVDDGIATGATMIVAARWVKKHGAAKIIIAVPVIPSEMLDTLAGLADRIVYLSVPKLFFAIGQFYREFEQVEDSEVREMLDESWKR